MPHANIWIRKENEDRWNSITDKSEWVNLKLTGEQKTWPTTNEKRTTKLQEAVDSVSLGNVKVTVPNTILPSTTKSPAECKNGHPLDHWGYCLQLNCKYAR